MARKQTAHVKICAPGHQPPGEGENDIHERYTRIHDPDNHQPEPDLLREAMESWVAFKNKYLGPKAKKNTGS